MGDRLAPIRGEITEIVGGLSSGRTSHLLACLGEVVGRGETAALVDTEEIFDPGSAAEVGIDLRRLLWVRCGSNREVALRAADMLVRCPGFALVALDLVEHFDAAAIERCEPALRERPLAILNPRVDRPNVGREGGPTARIMTTIEANTAAREQGVRPGMTETEARARCPMLLTRPWVEEYVASARHALLEAALAVSPRIEDGGAGLV